METKQTAVEWLIEQINNKVTTYIPKDVIEEAKQMEQERMIEFAEFVATYPDKNKNYLGEMLHAKSKYDSSERTSDLLEQYYNKTYGN